MTASEQLKALGFRLHHVRGSYEEWTNELYITSIAFNTYKGKQVAKIQRNTSHPGPVNSDMATYEAMVTRMRERTNTTTRRD